MQLPWFGGVGGYECTLWPRDPQELVAAGRGTEEGRGAGLFDPVTTDVNTA